MTVENAPDINVIFLIHLPFFHLAENHELHPFQHIKSQGLWRLLFWAAMSFKKYPFWSHKDFGSFFYVSITDIAEFPLVLLPFAWRLKEAGWHRQPPAALEASEMALRRYANVPWRGTYKPLIGFHFTRTTRALHDDGFTSPTVGWGS